MALNGDQQQAVDCLNHLLVVAGPGSGKTSTIVAKIESILGLDPKNKVCAVSFTRDSAEELNERINKRMPDSKDRVYYGTFHSLGLRMLKREGQKVNLVNGAQRSSFIFRAMSGLDFVDYEEASNHLEALKGSIEYVNNPDIDDVLFRRYQESLRNNHLTDFHDLMANCVRGLRDGSIKPVPCTHMMVDEFQDADQVQFEWMVEHIKRGIVVTVVGDDDQTIYGFRNALGYEGMLQFKEMTNADQVNLGINYRSYYEIVNAATRLILNNKARVSKNVHAAKGEGGTVRLLRVTKRGHESGAILEDLSPLLVPDSNPNSYYKYTAPKSKLAILARMGTHLDAFERELGDAGIRYYRPTKSIWERAMASLYLDMLESISVNTPTGYDRALGLAGLEHDEIMALHRQAGNKLAALMTSETPFESPNLSPGGLALANSLRGFAHNWKKQAALGRTNIVVGGISDWIIQRIKELPDYEAPKDDMSRGSKSYYESLQVESACRIFQKRFTGDIMERVKRLRSLSKAEPEDEFPGIALLTMHGSKGLEFDNVWICSVDENVIPGSALDKAVGQAEAQRVFADERRLLFVAMTRARNQLTLSATVNKESSFLIEAGVMQ